MSDYKSLKIYSYQNPGEPIDKELDKRKNGYGSIKFPLYINPIDTRDKGNEIRLSNKLQLFFVPIPDYNSLLNAIRKNSSEIKKIIDELPGIASGQFFVQMLIKEIKGTNDIENVYSTTEEISDAIVNADNKKKSVRLQSFAKMYLSIQQQKVTKIQSLIDIRNLYDFLLKGEISDNKLPDGNLFRDNFVRIGSNYMTVHLPKDNETDISKQLDNWIHFINSDDFDSILKACVAHYYFEYIHPFYDGNGRLGRYIFCSYIGKKVDPYTAISFSYQINLKKKRYYKEFAEVENKKNFGEITFFVNSLLKYLVSGQKYVLERLKLAKNMLAFIEKGLGKVTQDKKQRQILYVYSQAFLFNDIDGSIDDDTMKEFMKKEDNLSYKRTREELDALEKVCFIKKVKKRPIKRTVSKKFLITIGLDM